MPQIAAYARVSTPDQSLRRQVLSTLQYARNNFDAETGAREDEVIADYVSNPDTSDEPVEAGDVTLYYDRATGTDTQREGYQEMLGNSQAVKAVVSHSVSRISRSIRDLDETADEIVEQGDTELHIISEGFELKPEEEDPFQEAMFQLLGVFSELEANLAQQRSKEGLMARMNSDDYHHGPAPLGFEKEDGELYQAANYDEVCSVLEFVDAGQLSKRKAAKKLNTSRATINRSLEDRRELYGL